MKKHKTMRLPQELIKEIEKMAKKQNRSFNNMVEVLLLNGVSL
jgi:predicted HicB family RNase H-like nuclease